MKFPTPHDHLNPSIFFIRINWYTLSSTSRLQSISSYYSLEIHFNFFFLPSTTSPKLSLSLSLYVYFRTYFIGISCLPYPCYTFQPTHSHKYWLDVHCDIVQILVFWVVTTSSLVGRYHWLGGICYLHLHGLFVKVQELTPPKRRIPFARIRT
jgi:hypothetical protein